MQLKKLKLEKSLKKLTDWRWRLNHIYKIVDKHGQLITLNENPVQARLNDSTARRKRILKYRQGGISTNEIIKQLDHTLFHRNVTACVLAHDQDGIEKIFNIAKVAYNYMPAELKPEIAKGGGSKYEMFFPALNSRIYCDLSSRGDTIHWLHISEAAFADSKRIKATLETVPLSGRVTWETTPNGMGNHFYRTWVEKDDFYEKIFLPWYIDPQYQLDPETVKSLTDDELELVAKAKKLYNVDITKGQIAFRRFKQNDLKELFPQEYPEDDISCFLASGNSPLDLNLIQKLIRSAPEPVEKTSALEIYKPFSSEGRYVIGCDTAEGVRRDYSVAVVIECKKLEIVAVLRSNNLKPQEFGNQVFDLGQKYQKGRSIWPLVAVERNNHGHAVILQLGEIRGYPNMFTHSDEKLGWKTDSVTRPLMVDTLIEAIESEHLTINSKSILYECLTLVDNGGKIEAEDGETDDCIIASAIALQMAIKHGNFDLYDNLRSKILL